MFNYQYNYINTYRVHIHCQRHLNSFHPLKKLTIQLCIYALWSTIYYCPSATYNLFVAIDSKIYSSPQIKSVSTIIGVFGIQLYPILTYVMFWNHKKIFIFNLNEHSGKKNIYINVAILIKYYLDEIFLLHTSR